MTKIVESDEHLRRYLCAFAIDVSGPNPNQHDIISLSARRISYIPSSIWNESLKVEGEIDYRVFPRTRDVDPTYASLNGYDPNKWQADASPLPQVLTELYPLFEGSVPISFRTVHDLSFLYSAIDRLGWTYPKFVGMPLDLTSAFADLYLCGDLDRLGPSNVIRKLLGIKGRGSTSEQVASIQNLLPHL
jgi:hypothetical protein